MVLVRMAHYFVKIVVIKYGNFGLGERESFLEKFMCSVLGVGISSYPFI